MSDRHSWFIVQCSDGTCDIVPESEMPPELLDPSADSIETETESPSPKSWGPFADEGEAIARRVGLIRAGKCKPV